MPSRRDEVLAHVAAGKSTAEIAALCGITESTVRYYREPSKQRPSMKQMVTFLYKRAVAQDQTATENKAK